MKYNTIVYVRSLLQPYFNGLCRYYIARSFSIAKMRLTAFETCQFESI